MALSSKVLHVAPSKHFGCSLYPWIIGCAKRRRQNPSVTLFFRTAINQLGHVSVRCLQGVLEHDVDLKRRYGKIVGLVL